MLALVTESTKPFLFRIFGFVSIEGVGGSRELFLKLEHVDTLKVNVMSR